MKFLAVVFGAFLVNEAFGCVACDLVKGRREKESDDWKPTRGRKDDDDKPHKKDCADVYEVDYKVKLGKRKENERDEQNKYVKIGEYKQTHEDESHHFEEEDEHPHRREDSDDEPRREKKWLRREKPAWKKTFEHAELIDTPILIAEKPDCGCKA